MRLMLTGVLVAAALLGACAKEGSRPSVLMAEDLGNNALQAGDYAKAERYYTEAVDQSPGRLPARVGLGKALLGQSKAAAARSHLEVALTRDPTNSEVAELLAESMLQAGEVDAMVRLLKTRALDRQRVEDWLRLGRFQAKAHDADGAEVSLLTAARIDKGQTIEPQLELADFYRSIGDNESAFKRLRMAYFLKPQDENVLRRIRELGEVPGPTMALQPAEIE